MPTRGYHFNGGHNELLETVLQILIRTLFQPSLCFHNRLMYKVFMVPENGAEDRLKNMKFLSLSN